MSKWGVRVLRLLFDKEQDADVIERMEKRPSTMTSYVRELVRRDMHDEQLRKTATMLASARTDLLAENANLRETLQRRTEQFEGMTEMWVERGAENAKLRELVVLWSVINKHMSLCANTDCGQCSVREECGESVYLEGLLGIDPKGPGWRVQERMAETTDVQAENAKLRELIGMIGNVCDGTSEVCEYCKNYSATNDECMMLKQMQELGVEVDE